ncbi:FapA family protein [Paenibacillus physcomitrellae]|uniref:RNA-binding protein KhpB N-terminal domain-containing protein n=1 Tax=Paenibacillus physcomitrellae TaxID=1619311 RepID=A0ABQ1FTY3_9BACL|nr:FapA family protein [Paenibacillus physcomitrellae]GGA29682.1 hypothetical protein GCM10010917_13400 [Paenibacillus physcomitrellae]
MGNKVIAKGRSIQEALLIALDLLSADKHEVDIEILENEKKGLLGFRNKPAVVRVTLKETDSSPASAPEKQENADADSLRDPLRDLVSTLNLQDSPDFEQTSMSVPHEEDLSGKVWVQNGLLFSKDAEDKFPVIQPGKGVKLYKNGQIVERATVIHERDQLLAETEDEEVQPVWEVKISEDKMEAHLSVKPGYKLRRSIRDMEPSNFVLLEAEEKRVPILLDDGEVMQKLRELGIVHGVNYAQIASACLSEEEETYLIAKGSPYLEGKQGYFMPYQQMEVLKGIRERADGTVNYRDIQEFPSVDRGQIIGIVVPPVPGYPGVTVTNEPLFPPEVFPLLLQAGHGVELVEGDSKVVALDTGHPDIKQSGREARISVVPKLTIVKDINMETGNIRYIGEVEIKGSVQDGMTVQADGNLMVRGNANMATIMAGKSVIIQHNVISSEVTAGKSNLVKTELQASMQECVLQMKKIVTAIQQLSLVSAFKVSSFQRTGLGPLLKILYDGKFKQFSSLVSTLVQQLNEHSAHLEPEWEDLSRRLHRGFLTLNDSILKSSEEIKPIIQLAENLIQSSVETAADELFINAGFVQNSQIYSAGDIWVTGKGIYNSKMFAHGHVNVKGYVRGGEIFAAKGVTLEQAGTKGGITTKIKVPETEKIYIKLAMEDTLIQIGSHHYKFVQPHVDVTASLSSEGRLIIS